jgi:hypothetical protein
MPLTLTPAAELARAVSRPFPNEPQFNSGDTIPNSQLGRSLPEHGR